MMLTDDQASPQQWPTRANMLYQMQMLVWDLRPGDSLFFSFSGTFLTPRLSTTCQDPRPAVFTTTISALISSEAELYRCLVVTH